MHADHYHYQRPEIRRGNLMFQTALIVLVVGLGIGIFSDSTGFMNQGKAPQNYQGFKTVNVVHYAR